MPTDAYPSACVRVMTYCIQIVVDLNGVKSSEIWFMTNM